MPLKLYGTDSYCHKSKSLIVRSRDGGFVTQNCTVCGDPRALSFHELPKLQCAKCLIDLIPMKNVYGNYAYRCENCKASIELATIVPKWDEEFKYKGFGLDSDFDELGNNKYK